ncbi:phage repressor protein C with HTH and peptisase S24 domain [Rahnella sp. BIGb0603]|uniref:phage repressor protein CI n=1 Tax=Rahnella sp. BIGb0603 TaxID=2940612 RepID=UPI002169C26D|nr:phage repressor protein CI [Rahnella sp. BIGb0603]MCS3425019.1 phage repressor protein C with HTH and peptisase S24 domain [Rahnella sp. BIGb0603]
MDFKTGGQKVILRLVEAYGFSTRQMLCDHLGVSKSTLATRFMRDIFPAEWVIQCALETGASLGWLVSGDGTMFNEKSDLIKLSQKKILREKLYDAGYCVFDKVFLPQNLSDPFFLQDGNFKYIADQKFAEVTDGKWLVNIDGNLSVRNLIKLPGDNVRVESNTVSFDCKLREINVVASIRNMTTEL